MQAYELRDFAYEQAVKLRQVECANAGEEVQRARGIADLVRSWTVAQDRIRIMRGRPLPGSLRPEKKPRRRRGDAGLGPLLLAEVVPDHDAQPDVSSMATTGQ